MRYVNNSFRKVIRAYQDSWDNRCRILFCCIGKSDRNRVSYIHTHIQNKLIQIESSEICTLNCFRKFKSLIKINERLLTARQIDLDKTWINFNFTYIRLSLK
jgi:hypothetical protein